MSLLVKQYGKLKDINQRLKYISDIYYIGNNGRIYMKSLIPFIEKFAIINENIDISAYKNSIFLPNKTYGFTSIAKKSKLSADFYIDKIILSDTNEDDVKLELNLVDENTKPYSTFYKNLDLILDGINGDYITLGEDNLQRLISSEVVYIPYINTNFTITKNIFMCIKKTDSIDYKILDAIDPLNEIKKYVLFRKSTDLMSIYTLTAFACFE